MANLLATRAPKVNRWLPGFIVRKLQRIVHEEEVNFIIESYGECEGVEFIDKVLQHLGVTFTLHGVENIPADGRFIFASNHPLGGFDGIVMLSALQKQFGSVKAVVNDILMYIQPLAPLFVPVNKHGKQSPEYARLLRKEGEGKGHLLFFPAGLCSRRIKGVVTDLPWKKKVLQVAREYKRDVIPVYFDGRNSNFFHNLSSFRRFFHLPNIEMLFLPDELFRQRGAHFHVYLGKPISYDLFADRKNDEEMLTFVRRKVYELKERKKED
ncbi:MAG: 1-acyl-sn-glycerol-3-phosphate acyltransferase [Prevotellaceae bacterium]|nr:1-acyl-sn-glycerol-3-phosphate acyltransferase [Prevotellaceae bacterium]